MPPLQFHQLYYLVVQGLGLIVKSRNWFLHIIQAIVHLNIIQKNYCGIIRQTLTQLRDMERDVDLDELI